MKKILLVLAAGLLMLSACVPNQPVTPAGPGVETIVAATLQALTAAAPVIPPTSTPPNGIAVSFQNVSFVIPTGLAANALAGTVPAVPVTVDGPGWDIAPEHIKFQLENYARVGTFHEPHILIIPAQEYAALNQGASTSITRLQALISGAAAPTAENLPFVPYFNAGQVFAAQIQLIQFQNGSGVRFLTEYAQYYATANNADMFYHFQGLTNDGKYYIIALLPASHPLLAPDESTDSPLPAGGIPFPGFDDQAAIEAYYPAVVNLLNSAAPDSFNPTLSLLDALIQSITIAP